MAPTRDGEATTGSGNRAWHCLHPHDRRARGRRGWCATPCFWTGRRTVLSQLEASLEIISRIQSTLDSHRQLREIVELICAEHGYDRAKIYRWVENEQRLLLVHPSQPG